MCMYVCAFVCIRWLCQINRLKGETVGRTGQDFGLRARASFAYESLTESEVKTGGRAVCVPTCLLR